MSHKTEHEEDILDWLSLGYPQGDVAKHLGVSQSTVSRVAERRRIAQTASSLQTVVALPDIHYPYQDKGSLAVVGEFLKDLQPNYIIYMGDQMDLEMLMNRRKGIPDTSSIVADYEGFNEIMEHHIKLCPGAKIIFLEGNHEYRVEFLLQEHPWLKGSGIEIAKYFRFKERQIEYVRYNKLYTLGKKSWTHGFYYNVHHASKTVMQFYRCISYGHTHDRQAYTQINPADIEDVHLAQSIGCLCNVNPNWRKNRPNRWVHGLEVTYIDKATGYFNDYFIKITAGKFIFGGKCYGK